METKRCLICTDLDGSLLLPDGSLSSYAEETLRLLEKKGHLVVLCSGRPLRSILPYYNQADLHGPIIADNGASLYFLESEEYRYPPEMVEEVFHKAQEAIFSFMAEGDKTIYLDKPDPVLAKYFPFKGMEIKSLEEGAKVEESCHTLLFGVKEGKGGILKEIASAYPGVGYRSWHGVPYGEFYFLAGGKGDRLKEIRARNHIEFTDIYAFGDSDNDAGMLSSAGHPYAMKNAKSPHLKSLFPLSEKSNAEDGVAYELRKIFSL